jgi:hypothetical protein
MMRDDRAGTDLSTIIAQDRPIKALARFVRHGPGGFAVAGSIAMAAQWARSNGERLDRAFGDIDLVASALDAFPESLADAFICPHVHAAAEPGRMLAQFVHPADAVRIDVFRAIGSALSRAKPFRMGSSVIGVLSIEDQAARAASLCLKLTRGGSVVAKHLPDFNRLRPVVSPDRIDSVWREYRRADEPLRFLDAAAQIEAAARAHPERLIAAEFNRDPNAVCPNCAPWGALRPVEPMRVIEILGYA